MTSLIRRLWYRMTQARHDADLAEEIETHRQLRQAQLERDGLSPADAALASRRALGNLTLAREDAREVWTFAWIEHAWQDLVLAVRGLRHSKTFTLVAVGTLALGIGANTALFSIFNSLLLRELPVREPARLVILDQGLVHVSDLAGRRGADDVGVRGRLRLQQPRTGSRGIGTASAGRRRLCQRRPVRRARRHGDPRPAAAAVRRPPRRECPRGGDQPPLLAAALRGRRQRDRRHAHARSPALHHRRRDAAGLRRGRTSGASRTS